MGSTATTTTIFRVSSALTLLGMVIIIGCACYWWYYIRFDFPFSENKNPEAMQLYDSVMTIIVSIIIIVVCTIILGGTAWIASMNNYDFVSEIAFKLLIFLVFAFTFTYFVTSCVCVSKSRDSYCNKIYENGLEYGRSTIEFTNWALDHDYNMSYSSDVEKLNHKQCQKPHVIMSIAVAFYCPSYICLVGVLLTMLLCIH